MNENGAVLGRMRPLLARAPLLRTGCAPGKFGTWGLWGFIQSTPAPHHPTGPTAEGAKRGAFPQEVLASQPAPGVKGWAAGLGQLPGQGFPKALGRRGVPILPDSVPLPQHFNFCLHCFQNISIYRSLGTLPTPPICPYGMHYCRYKKQWRHPIIPPSFPTL